MSETTVTATDDTATTNATTTRIDSDNNYINFHK